MNKWDLVSRIYQNGEFQLFDLIDNEYDWETKNKLKEIVLKFAKAKSDFEMLKREVEERND